MTKADAIGAHDAGKKILVTFSAIRRYSRSVTETRVVRYFDDRSRPVVRYAGCADFMVRDKDIRRFTAPAGQSAVRPAPSEAV